MASTVPSNINTPVTQDKSFLLVLLTPLAGLLSTFLAGKLGLNISPDLIMQLATGLAGLFVTASKVKQTMVARAEADANGKIAAAQVTTLEDAAKELGAK